MTYLRCTAWVCGVSWIRCAYIYCVRRKSSKFVREVSEEDIMKTEEALKGQAEQATRMMKY